MPLIELRAAQHLAARPEHLAAIGAGIGLGLEAPIDRRVGEGFAEAERDVDPAVGVLAAGFEQDDARARVFGEPRRDRAAGRAGADDDEIGLDRCLALRPSSPPHALVGRMMAGRRGGASRAQAVAGTRITGASRIGRLISAANVASAASAYNIQS